MAAVPSIFLACFLLPAVVLARDPNPFVTPMINATSQNPVNVFKAHTATPSKIAVQRRVELPLPPLPPSIPVALEPTSRSASSAPRAIEAPAAAAPKGAQASHTCQISSLPAVPIQGRVGGAVIVRLSDSLSRCIAGVEARDEWVRIKFFNGRELHLEIDPNPRASARESTLIFASLTDSQLLPVSQLGASGSGTPGVQP